MKTLHICKASQLNAGDTLVFKKTYYFVSYIEEEKYGYTVGLVDNFGNKRVRFMTQDEIITI